MAQPTGPSASQLDSLAHTPFRRSNPEPGRHALHQVVDDCQNGPDQNPEDNTATLATPVEPTIIAPDLALQITDSGVSVPPGGTILYQLSYRNRGGDATGVVGAVGLWICFFG